MPEEPATLSVDICPQKAFLHLDEETQTVLFEYMSAIDVEPLCERWQAAIASVSADLESRRLVAELQSWFNQDSEADADGALALLAAGALMAAGSPCAGAIRKRVLVEHLFAGEQAFAPGLLSHGAAAAVLTAWASFCSSAFIAIMQRAPSLLEEPTRRALVSERALHNDMELLLMSRTVFAKHRRAALIAHMVWHCKLQGPLLSELPCIDKEQPNQRRLDFNVRAAQGLAESWGLDDVPFSFVAIHALLTFAHKQYIHLTEDMVSMLTEHDCLGEQHVEQLQMDLPVHVADHCSKSCSSSAGSVGEPAPVYSSASGAGSVSGSQRTSASHELADHLSAELMYQHVKRATAAYSSGALIALLLEAAWAGMLQLCVQECMRQVSDSLATDLYTTSLKRATQVAGEQAEQDLAGQMVIDPRQRKPVSTARQAWRWHRLHHAAKAVGLAAVDEMRTCDELDAVLAKASLMETEWSLFVARLLPTHSDKLAMCASHPGLETYQIATLAELAAAIERLPSHSPAAIDAEWQPVVSGLNRVHPTGRLQVAIMRERDDGSCPWEDVPPALCLPLQEQFKSHMTVVVLDILALHEECADEGTAAELAALVKQLVLGEREWVCSMEGAEDLKRLLYELGDDLGAAQVMSSPVFCKLPAMLREAVRSRALTKSASYRLPACPGLSLMHHRMFGTAVLKFWQLCDEWNSCQPLSAGPLEYAALDAAAALEIGCWTRGGRS